MSYIEINTAADTSDIPALIISNPLPRSGRPGDHAHARTEKICQKEKPEAQGTD